ncbi:NAD(P)-dependent oxidoreductase [Vibrio mangrovi]|uniref:3-hydroxyisobutyrate dehydrogenase n=1 Tax=Vibrio mangrovi TaxID=474394 RepID=A0A1Y6IUV6_9VIBR|nr:NAD(P)-dependent oxidoreductase [Vibrio mangrovi]MDW6003387.1 NAD(P)-dependent oxidoreductase [Vibrio mangrovi]SMR99823.1 3-hydroxyisobutyrate dehydrogenase [Vibrio mangrovi]
MADIVFIGLGHMGSPMAAKLIESSHNVEIFDTNPAAYSHFDSFNCHIIDDLSVVDFKKKIVMSMLPNDEAALKVFSSANYIESIDSSTINVSMSTLSSEMVSQLQEIHYTKGAVFINCPVFGRPETVRAGKLFGILSCKPELKHQIENILSSFCERVFYFGSKNESTVLVKLAANFLVISAIEAISESCEFLEKNGLDSNVFVDMITNSLFDCTVYHYHSKNIANRVYFPCGFSMDLGLKDIRLFNDECDSLNIKLPFSKVIETRIKEGVDKGRSEYDWAAIRESSYL